MPAKSDKFLSSITGAALLISFTSILTKGLGFLREVLFANYFGLEEEFDIYLVGAVIPLTINVIIYHLTQNYLIPTYNKLKKNDKSDLDKFINTNFSIFVLGGVLLSILLYFLSHFIINIYLSGVDIETLNIAENIFNIFLITIPFNCAISVISIVHHLNFNFKYPAYSQLILNMSFILFLILLTDFYGIYVIPWAYIFSSLFQLLYLTRKINIRYRLLPSINHLRKYKKLISSSIWFIILIESISQLYFVSDRFFYEYIPTGGIASINYAQTIFHLPISILSASLATVIFPKFSELINSNSKEELKKKINESFNTIVIIFVPIVILYLEYGGFFLKIFFERGKFTSEDTLMTYNVLFFLSLSLVFYSIYSIINKLIYSLGLIKNLFFITFAGISLKIILNFLFAEEMKQNGLALSTSISYMFFFFTSIILVNKKTGFKFTRRLLWELIFHFSNGLLCLILTKLLAILIDTNLELLEIILFIILFITNAIFTKQSTAILFYKLYSLRR